MEDDGPQPWGAGSQVLPFPEEERTSEHTRPPPRTEVRSVDPSAYAETAGAARLDRTLQRRSHNPLSCPIISPRLMRGVLWLEQEDQTPYYYNPSTGSSRWDRPTLSDLSASPPEVSAAEARAASEQRLERLSAFREQVLQPERADASGRPPPRTPRDGNTSARLQGLCPEECPFAGADAFDPCFRPWCLEATR